MGTSIEWTDESWNPVTGCSHVSEGCRNCYAERLALRKLQPYDTGLPWTKQNAEANVRLHPERLEIPLRWRKPRRVFVNSMSDLFHEQVPDEFIAAIFGTMAAAPQHTFQVLTKRPKRMIEWFQWVVEQDHDSGYDSGDTIPGRLACCWEALRHEVLHHPDGDSGPIHMKYAADPNGPWPLPNVHLGVSVENQETVDKRIPLLLETPAAVRFVSAEPLLGLIDLSPHIKAGAGIDQVIVGGESGPGARPMHPQWARSIRDQCIEMDVAFFFKQWGEWVLYQLIAGDDLGGECRNGRARIVQLDREPDGHLRCGDVWMRRVGKKTAGRLLDGREWSEYP